MNADELRPSNFNEYCGQANLKARLNVHIGAARATNRPLDHILLTGPPGAGKTSLANIIANEVNDPFESLTMPVTDSTLQKVVGSFAGVLLLDELHDANNRNQMALHPLLEFGCLKLSNGRQIQNGWLTIVGATTEPEKILPALRDRFAIQPVFEEYTPEDMAEIVRRMSFKAGITLSDETSLALGTAAGGIPRNARRLVLAARDLYTTTFQEPSAEQILTLCGIEPDGLDENHIQYLRSLDNFGGQAGLKMLASSLRLHERVCLDLERLLTGKNFITYGPTGRELTAAGQRRLRTGRP